MSPSTPSPTPKTVDQRLPSTPSSPPPAPNNNASSQQPSRPPKPQAHSKATTPQPTPNPSTTSTPDLNLLPPAPAHPRPASTPSQSLPLPNASPTTPPLRSSPTRKRRALSMNDRARILEEYHRRKRLKIPHDQRTLSNWAMATLSLTHAPSQSTISRIMTRTDLTSTRVLMQRGQMQRNRQPMHPALERALYCWAQMMLAGGKSVSGDKVREMGERMLSRLNSLVPDGKRVEMKFSNGWLQRFWERRGLRGRVGKSFNGSGIKVESVQELRTCIEKYEWRDVFCSDEFGHCWDVGLEEAVKGGKGRQMVVYVVCGNVDGSEKCPLMVVGKREGAGVEGVVYEGNGPGRMTVEMWHGWLVRFGEWVKRSGGEGRKVLLIVDGWMGHGGVLPEVGNVEVRYCAEEAMPMARGVIRGLKVRYRKAQVERALDMLDVDEVKEEQFRVGMDVGITTIKDIWERLPGGLILGSWRRSGLEWGSKDTLSGVWEAEEKLIEGVKEGVKELVLGKGSRLNMEKFIEPEGEQGVGVGEFGEEECVQMAYDEVMSDARREAEKGKKEAKGGSGAATGQSTKKTELDVAGPGTADKLKAVVLVKHMLQRDGGDELLVKKLREMQSSLRKKLAQEKRQSSVAAFLRPHWAEWEG